MLGAGAAILIPLHRIQCGEFDGLVEQHVSPAISTVRWTIREEGFGCGVDHPKGTDGIAEINAGGHHKGEKCPRMGSERKE